MKNTERFTTKADAYAKYRPLYAEAFYEYLYGTVGFSAASTVADVGSGTGLFCVGLLERGSRVFGVEPNREMRKHAEKFLARFENFTSVDGTAERTTLADAQADFATAAQAFHWFDKIAFKRECGRILKPGGKVALVWNKRDPDSEIVKELKAVKEAFDASSGTERIDADEYADFFEGGCERRTFANDLTLTKDRFVGEALSSSYAPGENDKNYAPFVEALESLFDKRSRDGALVMPLLTKSYVGTV